MVTFENSQMFTALGILFIIIGIIFFAIPIIAKLVPSIERIPPILIWVYKNDGLYIATSPILIILSLISILFYFFKTR